MAAQLTGTKVPARCMAVDGTGHSSLPVPLSPMISTVGVGAAFSAISSASSSLGLSPNVPSNTKLRASKPWRRSRRRLPGARRLGG